MERLAGIENISYLFTEDQIREAAKKTSDWLVSEIKAGQAYGVLTAVLLLALVKDFFEAITNLFLVGFILDVVPGLRLIINGFFFGILHFFMQNGGWFFNKKLYYEVRLLLWGLGFFIENVPAINTLPMTTISVFMIWRKIKKRAEKAKIELEDLQYLAAEEIEWIREAQVENEVALKEGEDRAEGSLGSLKEKEGGTTQEVRIVNRSGMPRKYNSNENGGGESLSQKKGGPGETLEEIFIPQDVRDPLGKLKREYFETPPDQLIASEKKIDVQKTKATPSRPKSKMDLEIGDGELLS